MCHEVFYRVSGIITKSVIKISEDKVVEYRKFDKHCLIFSVFYSQLGLFFIHFVQYCRLNLSLVLLHCVVECYDVEPRPVIRR